MDLETQIDSMIKAHKQIMQIKTTSVREAAVCGMHSLVIEIAVNMNASDTALYLTAWNNINA
jgi:tagatose-1,6-bisphosphate aldolase non-catalytic subunit AgaZ/GatZ